MLMRYPLPGGANDNEWTANRPHNPDSSFVRTRTQNDKNAGCVDKTKRTVYTLCVTALSGCALLHCTLDVQLFLQPQLVPHRDYMLSQSQKFFL